MRTAPHLVPPSCRSAGRSRRGRMLHPARAGGGKVQVRPGASPRDEDDLARRTAHELGLARRAGRRRGCQRRPARGGARAALRRRSDGQARRVTGGRDVRSKTRWLAGFLQFAPRIACRRVLHRRRSQEIRCRGLCLSPRGSLPRQGGEGSLSRGSAKTQKTFPAGRWPRSTRPTGWKKKKKSSPGAAAPLPLVMIPPLVHQRRPCYDFYFL